MNDWRDAHFAHVIERGVMRQGGRALILIGGAHISRKVMFPNSLIHLLDVRFPGQTWVAGVLDLEQIEPEIRSRIRPDTGLGGTIVRNTWLEKVDGHRLGFDLSSGDFGVTLMRCYYGARRGFTLNLQHHSIRPIKAS